MNIPELKAALARKNISIPKLAELIGTSKKTMYSRFSGNTDFSQSEISQISGILELSDSDILLIFFNNKVS